MQLGEIVETAIAQVVPMSKTNELADTNKNFVRSMVNKGYHIIERKALWKFSEAEEPITAVRGEIVCEDVPEDMGIPVLVWSHRMKRELLFHDDRQRVYPNHNQGIVQSYSVWGDEFRFHPIPDTDEGFTLRYYKSWPDLVNDEDEPVFPETWHDLLVDHASGWLAMRLPATGERFLTASRAQPFLDTFNARLEEMANSDLVMTTWDSVPNYDYEEHVIGLGEW